jgi:Holliday junction resolvasome RuvABC endonuclease subunit
VLFESLETVVDWSVKEVRRVADKNARCLDLLGRLVDLHRPNLIAIADWRDPKAHRRERVRELLPLIATMARNKNIAVATYSKDQVASVFAGQGARTKYDIARSIARMFPELARRLPRRRRIWEGEQYQMAIFDAAAIGITHLVLSGDQGRLPFPPRADQ